MYENELKFILKRFSLSIIPRSRAFPGSFSGSMIVEGMNFGSMVQPLQRIRVKEPLGLDF